MGKHIYHNRKDFKYKSGFPKPKKSELSNFMIEYLGEIETEFENT